MTSCAECMNCIAAGDYSMQIADGMDQKTRGLLILREDLRWQNVQPGISLYNRADGYWLPLREVSLATELNSIVMSMPSLAQPRFSLCNRAGGYWLPCKITEKQKVANTHHS